MRHDQCGWAHSSVILQIQIHILSVFHPLVRRRDSSLKNDSESRPRKKGRAADHKHINETYNKFVAVSEVRTARLDRKKKRF